MALANDLRQDLWAASLNCGGLAAALERNRIDKAKVSMIAWQFLRCGTDAMYILDTRLMQDQGRQVIETLRSLLPPETFIRQSPLAPQPSLKHGKPGQDSTLRDKGRVGGHVADRESQME